MMESPLRSAPVISLCVLDSETLDSQRVVEHSQVAVVVRDPVTNPTHPDVVSVPTQRIPLALYEDLVIASLPVLREGDSTAIFSGPSVESVSDSGHHPVVYAVEALLARKLGVSEGLERDTIRFSATCRVRVRGVARYEPREDAAMTEEWIDMLSILVTLDRGRELLPTRTASYSHIVWTDVARLLAGIRARDPCVIDSTLDPIQLCVHGVCLEAAFATLSLELVPTSASAEAKEHELQMTSDLRSISDALAASRGE